MGKPEEKVVCFQCGQPVMEDGPEGGPRLNEVEEGVPCRACADRLLEQLPAIFHTPWSEEPAWSDSDQAESDQAESDQGYSGGEEA